MRILHLVSYPLYSGPVPGTLALALEQRRLGHTVWLACDSRRGNFNGYEEAVAPHLVGQGLAPPVQTPLSLSTHASLMQHWADYRALRRMLRPDSLDIVHVHLSHDHALGAMARTRGLPLVRTVHARRALSRRFGQRLLMGTADHVICRSHAHVALLEAAFGKTAGYAATTIPGSIDAPLWRHPTPEAAQTARQAIRAALGIPKDAVVVGHVALIANRGQRELVAALTPDGPKASGQVHLMFVGSGEDADALKQETARLGLQHRVHMTGYLHADALKDAYAAMDAACVMQPGNDAAARAALEAMAAGLPVMAPNIEALGELVTEATGYVFAARSPAAVQHAWQRFYDDRQGGLVKGAQAQRQVQRERHVAQEAQATLAIYARLQAERKGAPARKL